MVNVPPIPPLLCSTPPPIDFGEDDEDVDVMPSTLDGVDDDDFGDFLTVDDKKNDEPLPSPRPPSICDLPAVSIYDGLISPEDEEHITTSPPPLVDGSTERENKSIPKPIHITEAFNFNIKNTCDINKENSTDEHKDPPTTETNKSSEVEIQNEIVSQSNHTNPDSQQESQVKPQNSGSTSSNRNINDLTIQTTNEESAGESNNNNNKSNISCMENMVSIEDIEDDLSDDELYSPKKPKNFIETDNLSDYFTIQEINSKSVEVAKDDLKALDNNASASWENVNDNIDKHCPNKSISPQYLYDMPPPLDEDPNQPDEEDDFGDFADFQDFSTVIKPPETHHFVNNTVPVEDVNNKAPSNNDLEYNGFNNFTDYNKTKESIHVNNIKLDENNSKTSQQDFNSFKSSADLNDNDDDDDFDDSTSHNNETKQEQISLETEITTQEISNGNFGDFTAAPKDTINDTEESSNVHASFGDFSTGPLAADKGYGKSTESPAVIRDDKQENAVALDSSEKSQEISEDNISNNDVDDEFGDFADFESHQEIPKPTETISSNLTENQSTKETFEKEIENSDVEDDDDFGDFNTAQPITPTASSLNQSKTSHNTIVAPTPTQPPHNLNERISKILYLMFSTLQNDADHDESKPQTNKIQDIPFTSIDSAKALEYQWLNSDTRHSFIKSLGIDSRNILFGENWNPSLPRFAANLSFNPLKPMKPIQACNTTSDTTSTLEPSTVNISESTKTLDAAGSSTKESLELNSKPFNMTEQTSEASKDNNSTKMPYVSNEQLPCVEPAQLTIFENPLENETTFSKTPPISEMESVSTFSSPSPSNAMDIEATTTQIANNITNFDLKEIEENLQNVLNVNEVVVTSTFTGSFKETHIYTPSKTNDIDTKQLTTSTASTTSLSSPSKASPIDFDYEKAAMGVIIDETVVKKEYRDVEYNPPFSMESLSKPGTAKVEAYDTNVYTNNASILQNSNDIKMALDTTEEAEGEMNDECSDDFTEFQSVTNEIAVQKPTINEGAATKTNYSTVSHGGMILSPAILIPQAISMENQKPKIEWGDSTATINPEELARIEELFPEPKSLKSSNASSSSQKSTPTHQVASTPSISATVAHKELEGDDDDWSDFVSVSVTNNTSTHRATNSNNNILTKSPAGSPFKQRSPVVSHRMPASANNLHSNSNNDDEWSDFVSSAPPSSQPAPSSYRIPQFNSGAWQNANFYNNPLSMYHKGPLNIPTATAKSLYNNNNNYSTISQQPYQIANNLPPVNHQMTNNVYHQQQQQIHVMQNFSTAPIPTPERLSAAAVAAKNNQFQVGSAKVAPSIALIPDLGFVAPAIPTHTSFINSLPKPGISTKK